MCRQEQNIIEGQGFLHYAHKDGFRGFKLAANYRDCAVPGKPR